MILSSNSWSKLPRYNLWKIHFSMTPNKHNPIAGVTKAKNIFHNHKRQFSSSSQPVVELREDILYPQSFTSYIETMKLGRNDGGIFPNQFCFLSHPEVGGMLNVASHAYYFESGLSERQEIVRGMEQNNDWKIFQDSIKSYIQSQNSSIFVEAPLVKQNNLDGMTSLVNTTHNDNCILEFRRYYLRLGYDTVPKFLGLYGTGLPSKLNAEGTDPTTSLVTLLHSEVGRLNEVIEIWKHGNGVTAMEQSRVAARKATEWRRAIAAIADLAIEFRSTIHRPIA